jgi:Uma2 family endonuclease
LVTVASPPIAPSDRRIVLPHVSWETYERLLADDEERRVPRLTYDQGVLEIVSPSGPHEEDSFALAFLVEIVAAVLAVPVRSVGSMTYRRRDLQRGFEPDASFYVQHEAQLRGRREIDAAVDPPPDLVIETDVSRSSLDKLSLFAAIGVPEVWRCDGQRVLIYVLDVKTYRRSDASAVLPPLTSDVLTHFLIERRTQPSPTWFQAVSDWARAQRTDDSSTQ